MRVSGNRRPRGGRSNSGGGRPGQSGGRGGQSGGNRRSNNGNRSYDSNGPDGKIRGSATQVHDKYVSLGQDAQTASDHVGAENYYQHAEHYYRIMLANNLVKPDRPAEQSDDDDDDDAPIAEANNLPANKASENNEKPAKVDVIEAPSPEKEPIIIDLSNPEAVELDNPDTVELDSPDSAEVSDTIEATEDVQETVDEAADDGEAKPKSKRRVSRTRGLRRRTSRRSTESTESTESTDSDEPQSAE